MKILSPKRYENMFYIDDEGHLHEMTFADKLIDTVCQVGGAFCGAALVGMVYALIVW